MSTKMSPVTTFMRGGRPPTPLGQEKPVPCMEQIQRTGSRMVKGSVGGDVAISVGTQQGERKSILHSFMEKDRVGTQDVSEQSSLCKENKNKEM